MKEYLLRLVCGSAACALVRSVWDSRVMKLLCGVYLAGLVLSPVVELDWELPEPADLQAQAESVVAQGASQAEQARDAGIKARCETYILEEAAALGLSVQAEVTVEQGLPTAVVLTGTEDDRLSQRIAQNLGIGKEAQTWGSLPP